MSANSLLDAGKSILSRINTIVTGNAGHNRVPRQRRHHLRVAPCHTEVLCHQGRDRHFGILRDISAGGMRLMLTRRIAPGSHMSVMSPDRDVAGDIPHLKVRVVWCRSLNGRFEAGLVCNDSPQIVAQSWLHRLLRGTGVRIDDMTDLRKRPRVTSPVRASVHASATFISTKVCNLSAGGACLEGPVRVGVGEFIDLFLPACGSSHGLAVTGRVLRIVHQNGHRRVHIEFVQLDNSKRQHLEQIVCQLMNRVA